MSTNGIIFKISGVAVLLYFIYLFIYIFYCCFKIYWLIDWLLCWVFVSVLGLSPVAVSGGHSSSRCVGLSVSRPLLLRSTGSRAAGSVVVAHGSVAPRHVESSQTRARTRVPCIGRQIVNQCTTREASVLLYFKGSILSRTLRPLGCASFSLQDPWVPPDPCGSAEQHRGPKVGPSEALCACRVMGNTLHVT